MKRSSILVRTCFCLFMVAAFLFAHSCKDPLEGQIPRIEVPQKLELLSNGDWQQVEGITGGDIDALIASDFSIIAATRYRKGVFRSTDHGLTWTSITSLPTNDIIRLARQGRSLVATTYPSQFYRSNDDGRTWQFLSTVPLAAFALYANESIILAAGTTSTSNGREVLKIARSTDGGMSWTQLELGEGGYVPASFTTQGANIFVSFYYGGLFQSSDNGESWQKIMPIGLPSLGIRTMASNNQSLFAIIASSGPSDALYQSYDNGKVWNKIVTLPDRSLSALNVKDSHITVSTLSQEIYRSTNNGATWTSTSIAGMVEGGVRAFYRHASMLFGGTDGGGVLRSNDNGQTWNIVNKGLTAITVTGIANIDKTLFVATDSRGVFRSQDNGATWTTVNTGLGALNVKKIVCSDKSLFVNSFLDCQRSDDGRTWSPLSSENTIVLGANNGIVLGLQGASTSDKIVCSSNNGLTWKPTGISANRYSPIAFQGNQIFMFTENGIYHSLDSGATWTKKNTSISLPRKDFLWNAAAASAKSIIVANAYDGLFFLKNGSSQWQASSTVLANVQSIYAVNDSIFFAGTSSSGVFRSNDYGATWQPMNVSRAIPYVSSLFLKGNNFFAGTQNNGLYRLPLR